MWHFHLVVLYSLWQEYIYVSPLGSRKKTAMLLVPLQTQQFYMTQTLHFSAWACKEFDITNKEHYCGTLWDLHTTINIEHLGMLNRHMTVLHNTQLHMAYITHVTEVPRSFTMLLLHAQHAHASWTQTAMPLQFWHQCRVRLPTESHWYMNGCLFQQTPFLCPEQSLTHCIKNLIFRYDYKIRAYIKQNKYQLWSMGGWVGE